MKPFLLAFLIFFNGVCFANSRLKKQESDFQKNFNIAKQHLSQREISKALPYLQYLLKNYPTNDNLKYLIGVCYAELGIVNPKTIDLLLEASSKASLEYDPNSLEEVRVPIYVYYYLSIAYSQNKMCEKAEKFRNTFGVVYPHKDKFYLDESQRWLELCFEMKEKPKEVPIPKFSQFKPYVSSKKITKVKPKQVVKVDTLKPIVNMVVKKKQPDEILTKRLDYSTEFPLFGVQLGAFKEVVPVSRFRSMKNVDAFMDKLGWIRYVIGHFAIYSQAESLLKVIQENGYPDAFIVNVNNEKKFAEEVISVNKVNIRANKYTNVVYRVQIGAFKEKFEKKSAELYLKVEGIKEHREDDITYLSVGKFKTYLEAKAYSQGIIDTGIADAFVIALTNGIKIPLQQVNDFKN